MIFDVCHGKIVSHKVVLEKRGSMNIPVFGALFRLHLWCIDDNVFCADDTIGDLKKLIAAQTGTHWEKIVLKKWYTIYKDHITLEDYEIHDGMNLELYYK